MASKWDQYKPKKQVTKKREEDPVSRVVPPMLARIPDVADWLFKDRTINISTRVAHDLKTAYRNINEMILHSLNKDNF